MARSIAALFATFLCLAATSYAARIPLQEYAEQPNKIGHKWAVLIAGSAGWGNYRHQADVYHAYQVLRRGGLIDKRIIVMHHDDIANSPNNPNPTTVINIPGGDDVYAGVPKDYTGPDVTAETFLAVLAGDKKKVKKTSGSKKVLAPNKHDEVFIYFADHGGPGVLGMPAPPFLHAKDLVDTLVALATKKTFKHITFYVEACESGSIFDGLLPSNLNIYVITAANPSESSWGYYCPDQTPGAPEGYDTCLGDLFSIAFLEDDDITDLRKETLLHQYAKVRRRTSNNGTYDQGSHVMMYGHKAIDKEDVSEYVGRGNKGSFTPEEMWDTLDLEMVKLERRQAQQDNNIAPASSAFARAMAAGGHARGAAAPRARSTLVSQRDAELVPLWSKFVRARGDKEKRAASAALRAELSARDTLDARITAAATAAHMRAVSSAASPANKIEGESEGKAVPLDEAASWGVLSVVRPVGEPLVDDWDCHKAMFQAWADAPGCGGYMPQYGMKHGRTLANLCNAGVTPDAFRAAAAEQCVSGSAAASAGSDADSAGLTLAVE